MQAVNHLHLHFHSHLQDTKVFAFACDMLHGFEPNSMHCTKQIATKQNVLSVEKGQQAKIFSHLRQTLGW